MPRDHGNRGVAWERCLEEWHARYLRVTPRPLAVVFRAPPPVRPLSRVGPSGRFTCVWASEGPPDFIGVLGNGLAVCFDAKDCVSGRWDFAALARHQARDLEAVHLAGGVSFVALRAAGQGWVLPWSELGPRWWAWQETEGRAARGTASIEPATAMWCRVMPTPGDWLRALP